MILYFSGTGNSRYVAEKLGTLLGDMVADCGERIRTGDTSEISSKQPFVVVCPTYAWQIPRILRDHLRETMLTGTKDAYFVMTCGDDIGSAGVHNKLLCEEKGLVYKGTAEIVMPENYIAMFRVPDKEKATAIISKAEPAICKTAETISSGTSLTEPADTLGKFKSGFVNASFYRLFIKDRKFSVGEGCTGCGLCEKLCCANNIRLSGGRPLWQGNCTHCMACICRCPQSAIEYGKKSVGQPRYVCPE